MPPILIGSPVAVSVARARAALGAVDRHLGRRHPFAVRLCVGLVHHHALGEQAGERLVDAGMAGRFHRAGEEARVEQMQNRVLDAADILIDRQPVVDDVAVGRRGP